MTLKVSTKLQSYYSFFFKESDTYLIISNVLTDLVVSHVKYQTSVK